MHRYLDGDVTERRNIYPIRPRGIIRDVEPLDVPPEHYTSGSNVIFRNNMAERISGYGQIFGTPLGNPIHIRANLRDQVAYWLYATTDKIAVTSGTTHSDITPTPAPANTKAADWTSCSLNGVPVLNYRTGDPVSWDGSPASACTSLPGWGNGHKCEAMRSFKNYLIALAYDNGVTADPNLVVWSDAAAPGNLPSSWTPAADNDAGSVSLAETDGIIIDGAPLKDQFICFKRGSTYTLDFIGGNFIFAVRKLFDTTGILARNCVVELRGRQYVMTDGDIIVHDGYQAQSLVDRRWRRFIFDNIDSENFINSFVTLYEAKSEIWFCFPTAGNEAPNVAVVYNYDEGEFGVRNLEAPATHADAGIVPAEAAPATDWDSQTASWDTYPGNWNQTNFNPAQDELVTANNDSTFYSIDTGADAAGADIVSTLSRESLDFGEPDRVKFVKAIWPRVAGIAANTFENGSSFKIRVGTQMEPHESITWEPFQNFTAGNAAKVDVLARGRLISVEIQSTGGGRWRCSGFDFEYELRGRY